MPFSLSNPELQAPRFDGRNTPFWDAARKGRFVLPKCRGCGLLQAAPIANCPNCLHDDFDWVEGGGFGVVYSHIEYYRAWANELVNVVPYTVALVTLDEGPFMYAGVIGCPGTVPLKVGEKVQVVFQERANGWKVPMFHRLAE